MIIESANNRLSEKFIKQLHRTLKAGTSDNRKDWFAVGDYKRFANELGGKETTLPENVADEMHALIEEYNGKDEKTLKISWIFIISLNQSIRFRMRRIV